MEVRDIIIITAAAVVFIAVIWLLGGYGLLLSCIILAGLLQ